MTIEEVDHMIATTILKPIYRQYDIEGAPYKISDALKVQEPTDDTMSMQFIGKIGKIIFFEYDCGCSQTFPEDPMIGVKFADGKVAEFWKEELCLTS